MAKGKKKRAPRYDTAEIRAAANGRWAMILSALYGISLDVLDGQHHPCPTGKCGSTRDAFRFTDLGGNGSAICNRCGKWGDGFAFGEFLSSQKFTQVIADVAGHLGIEPSTNGYAGKDSHSRESSDSAEHLEFLPWNNLTVAYWCLSKPPITAATVLACGGRLAMYRSQWRVVALPVWGEHLDSPDPATGLPREPIGWCMYAAQPKGLLPRFPKPGAEDRSIEWVKVKLTAGSKPGVIADLARLRSCRELWKLEGPTDLLAFLSFTGLPADVAAITNSSGAGEKPHAWMLELFVGKLARTCHDADEPGQHGAILQANPKANLSNVGWANLIASHASESLNVTLPYDVQLTHGNDLRDFANDPAGGSYAALATLLTTLAVPAELPPEAPVSNEAPDDPHRLARVNLKSYASQTDGATIRFWRDEFYTWKPSRGCYRAIQLPEFKAKVGASIKEEFDRVNAEDMEKWRNRPDAGDETPPPQTRKVTKTLTENVLAATASLTCIPSSVERMTWIADGARRRRNLVAMQNGLLDIDALLAGKPNAECVAPLSPEWFSTTRLSYAFNIKADCPAWMAFLARNLEADPERMNLLQEWAGYLLLPDTGQQKFLALEGEGSNGKSVYCAAVTAMLGRDNCSFVGVEGLSDKFVRTQTLGCLANICPDVGEIEKANEGDLKSFVSGDVMFFDRKYLSGLNCIPTARLMMSFNTRPRFSDRSSGVWRRMMIVPWRVQISEAERIENMDKDWWWEASGELPGIFNWALRGLVRLRRQGRFTASKLSTDAVEEYREESNPARMFLHEFCETCSGTSIISSKLYEHYADWIKQNGYKPLGEKQFGKEVKRVFPLTERKYGGSRADRYYRYDGLTFTVDEICGKKTSDSTLF